MSHVDTLIEYLSSMHTPSTQLRILLTKDITFFHWDIKSPHLLLAYILTVAQVAVVSYQTIPQHWCRKNKNATGKSGDCKCFGPCSVCRGLPEGM